MSQGAVAAVTVEKAIVDHNTLKHSEILGYFIGSGSFIVARYKIRREKTIFVTQKNRKRYSGLSANARSVAVVCRCVRERSGLHIIKPNNTT